MDTTFEEKVFATQAFSCGTISKSRRNQQPREQVESVGMVTELNDAWTVVSRWKPLVIGRWTDPGVIDNEYCRAAFWVYLGPFEMSGTSVASPFRSTTT